MNDSAETDLKNITRLLSWHWHLLNTDEVTALVRRKQQKQLHMNAATCLWVNWSFSHCWTFAWNKNWTFFLSFLSYLQPHHFLLLHIIFLSGGCGWHGGTVYCWCCRGALPPDIPWLPHCGGGDHNSCLTWLEYKSFVAAVEDVREAVGAFEVEKRGHGENQEQADQQCSQKKRGSHTWPSNFWNDSSYCSVVFLLHCIIVGADCNVLQIHCCGVTEYANSVAVLKISHEASWLTMSVIGTWIVDLLFLTAAFKWVLT